MINDALNIMTKQQMLHLAKTMQRIQFLIQIIQTDDCKDIAFAEFLRFLK